MYMVDNSLKNTFKTLSFFSGHKCILLLYFFNKCFIRIRITPSAGDAVRLAEHAHIARIEGIVGPLEGGLRTRVHGEAAQQREVGPEEDPHGAVRSAGQETAADRDRARTAHSHRL